MPAGTRAQALQTRANSSGVVPASSQVAYRALLERAGSREPADRRGIDGIGPRHIGLRLAGTVLARISSRSQTQARKVARELLKRADTIVKHAQTGTTPLELERVCKAWARVPAGIANARARSVAAPIGNREPQKSTGGGRKCSQLFFVEHEGGGGWWRELAWIDGRDLAIEYRWAEGRNERYAEIAAEFVRLKVEDAESGGRLHPSRMLSIS